MLRIVEGRRVEGEGSGERPTEIAVSVVSSVDPRLYSYLMPTAFITRRVLRWARQRHNITEVAVAKRLGTSPDRVRSWEIEDSEVYPTFRQAQNLAGFLNVPFGYLFLSEPPTLTVPIPDLRTVSGGPVKNPSPGFLDHLYAVLRKQEWYREHRQSQGAEPVDFVGRFSTNGRPDEIAADIVSTLELGDEVRRQSSNWEQFLTQFVRKAESAGVLVLRSGIVESNTHRPLSVSEFRGFAISDDLAPLVFVNARDAKSAQIFTLAHELAHLWVGESGISNPNYMVRPGDQVNSIDRLCDKVAAEVLVPKADFLLRWREDNGIPVNLQVLASHYRVSKFVVLRRALEMEKVTSAEFRAEYDRLLADQHAPSGESGGNFYNLLLARNSATLTHTLLAAAAEGSISQRDASRLLNVRIGRVESIRQQLLAGSENA